MVMNDVEDVAVRSSIAYGSRNTVMDPDTKKGSQRILNDIVFDLSFQFCEEFFVTNSNNITKFRGEHQHSLQQPKRMQTMYLDKNSFVKEVAARTTLWHVNGTLAENNHRTIWTDLGIHPEKTLAWIFFKVLDASAFLMEAFCMVCSDSANMVQAFIFNQIPDATNSPALALQAQTTNLLRMAYHFWLPLFDAFDATTITSLVSRVTPVIEWSFWAVVSLLATHIALCLLITARFMRKTRYSLIGSAWAAFAQVAAAEDAHKLLQESVMKSDEIVNMIKQRGRKRTLYYLDSGADVLP